MKSVVACEKLFYMFVLVGQIKTRYDFQYIINILVYLLWQIISSYELLDARRVMFLRGWVSDFEHVRTDSNPT